MQHANYTANDKYYKLRNCYCKMRQVVIDAEKATVYYKIQYVVVTNRNKGHNNYRFCTLYTRSQLRYTIKFNITF